MKALLKITAALVFCALLAVLSGCTAIKSDSRGTGTSPKAGFSSSVVSHANSVDIETNTTSGLRRYVNRDFKFIVAYPEEWIGEIDSTWQSTSSQEASPDGGITLFPEPADRIDKSTGANKNFISITGNKTQYGVQFQHPQVFETTGGIKGQIEYTQYDNGSRVGCQLLLADNHIHGCVNVDKTTYDKHKDEITAVFKSIEQL